MHGIVYDKGELRNKLKIVEKSLQQKTRDFDAGGSNHGDFTIVDFYNKVKERHNEDIKTIKQNIKDADDAYREVLDSLVVSLRLSLPGDTQSKARDEPLKFQHNPVQDAKLVALQARVANLETLLKEQVAERDRLLEKQDAEQEKRLKTQDIEHGARLEAALKAQRQEFQGLFKEYEVRQDERFKALEQSRDEWQDKMSKALETSLASSLQQSQTRPQNDEIEALKQANENLRAELSTQKKDLTEKVNEFDQRLRNALESIEQLRSPLHTVQDHVQDHGNTLKKHTAIIAQMDLETWDQMAEKWDFEFVPMTDKIRSLQSELESLKSTKTGLDGLKTVQDELNTLQADVKTFNKAQDDLKSLQKDFKGLKDGQDTMISLLGGELDKQNGRVEALEKTDPASLAREIESHSTRLKALEDDLEKAAVPAQAPATVPPLKEDASGADVKSEIGNIKTEVDGLKEVGQQRHESLMHIISSMQSQYDNINTMELANHIAGVMETLYPNTRQLSQDLDFLKSHMSEYKSQLGVVEQRMSENEQKSMDLFRDLSDIITRDPLGRPYKEGSRPSKRPRMELANGHQPVENGRHRS